MRFHYTTAESEPFPFKRVGGTLNSDQTVELNQAAYGEFLRLSEGTTHRLELVKEPAPWKR